MTTFHIWQSTDTKNWYWTATRKGRIVCDSAEGYKRRAECTAALKRTLKDVKEDKLTLTDTRPLC